MAEEMDNWWTALDFACHSHQLPEESVEASQAAPQPRLPQRDPPATPLAKFEQLLSDIQGKNNVLDSQHLETMLAFPLASVPDAAQLLLSRQCPAGDTDETRIPRCNAARGFGGGWLTHVF